MDPLMPTWDPWEDLEYVSNEGSLAYKELCAHGSSADPQAPVPHDAGLADPDQLLWSWIDFGSCPEHDSLQPEVAPEPISNGTPLIRSMDEPVSSHFQDHLADSAPKSSSLIIREDLHKTALSLVPRPNPTQTPTEQGGNKVLRCDWPGCKSKTVFRRNYELQRHKRKHNRTRSFPCTAVNCKFRGTKAFYREDKLKDHVFEGHDDNTLFACPIPHCLGDLNPLPRYLMAIHCRNHDHKIHGNYYKHLIALEDSDQKRKCPIDTCPEKRVGVMQQHLLKNHSLPERLQFRYSLAAEGFDASRGQLICPISGCGIPSETKVDLIDHLASTHLFKDTMHFLIFRDQFKKNVGGVMVDSSHSIPWGPWTVRVSRSFACQQCGVDAIEMDPDQHLRGFEYFPGKVTHHLEFLAASHQVEADKQQILKLIPEFATHPVFDPVLPLINRTSERMA